MCDTVKKKKKRKENSMTVFVFAKNKCQSHICKNSKFLLKIAAKCKLTPIKKCLTTSINISKYEPRN